MAGAHPYFVSSVAPRIAEGELAATHRLLSWLKPPGEDEPLQGAAAAQAIDALLEPWVVRAPDSDLQHLIEARLLAAYGDPRIRSTGVWSLISAGARRVVLQWLAGATHPGVLRYRDAGRPHAHVVGPQAPLDGPLRRWSHHASLVRTERCRDPCCGSPPTRARRDPAGVRPEPLFVLARPQQVPVESSTCRGVGWSRGPTASRRGCFLQGTPTPWCPTRTRTLAISSAASGVRGDPNASCTWVIGATRC